MSGQHGDSVVSTVVMVYFGPGHRTSPRAASVAMYPLLNMLVLHKQQENSIANTNNSCVVCYLANIWTMELCVVAVDTRQYDILIKIICKGISFIILNTSEQYKNWLQKCTYRKEYDVHIFNQKAGKLEAKRKNV